jgi:hypothetical protein
MKNLKLNTFDVMNVEVLNSKELVSTDGGFSIGTFTVDKTEGTYNTKGERVPGSYSLHKYELNIDDKIVVLFGQLLAHKGTAPA